MAFFFGILSSPVGQFEVTSDGTAITGAGWCATPRPASGGGDALLDEALRQRAAYFDGALTSFDLPIDLGTQSETTRAVLTTLVDEVGYGRTVTYGELAARSGTTVPARGIGAIMGANPIPIIVPCHRVVASDGLGGYSGGVPGDGLDTKRWLLEHEEALPPALF